MNYTVTKSSIEETKELLNKYLMTLTGVADDFWEGHIFESEFYKIKVQDTEVGYFAIFKQDKITQFYLLERYYYLAQPIFKDILEKYGIKNAMVSTADQLFLSLCLDSHKKIEMHAYFFDGTVMNQVEPPQYDRSHFIELKPEELQEVLNNTGDFFMPITKEQLETGENRLFKLCDEGNVLGYGIIVPNKLLTMYYAVGMIVLEKYRNKGIGRSIQLHLADITREKGHIPISGCWYYNHLSKKTIESAGRYTKTRLLDVIF